MNLILYFRMNKSDHMHRQNMYFHNVGLWGSDKTNAKGWRLRSLSSIVKELNHASVRLLCLSQNSMSHQSAI